MIRSKYRQAMPDEDLTGKGVLVHFDFQELCCKDCGTPFGIKREDITGVVTEMKPVGSSIYCKKCHSTTPCFSGNWRINGDDGRMYWAPYNQIYLVTEED